MKLKIEYIDGNIEFIKVESVELHKNANKLGVIYDSFKRAWEYQLELILFVYVDNEVIYHKFKGKLI